ncbi:hypothetical protein C3L33_11397, partial [Rhododendron williamsianum]
MKKEKDLIVLDSCLDDLSFAAALELCLRCAWGGFFSFCSRIHRQPERVMTFLLAELGTSGSLDGLQRLVVKVRFAPKIFEGILRRYGSKFHLNVT